MTPRFQHQFNVLNAIQIVINRWTHQFITRFTTTAVRNHRRHFLTRQLTSLSRFGPLGKLHFRFICAGSRHRSNRKSSPRVLNTSIPFRGTNSLLIKPALARVSDWPNSRKVTTIDYPAVAMKDIKCLGNRSMCGFAQRALTHSRSHKTP